MQVKRIPLVTQRAVVDRKAVGQPITWSKCKLSTAGEFPPCCTNINQMVIDVPKDCDNWRELEGTIWNAQSQSRTIRLVVHDKVPEDILFAASYSDKNVTQVNINMTQLSSYYSWLDKLMSLANRCGMWVVLYLHPIVPEIVTASQVVGLIDRFRIFGQYHINLQFCELPSSVEEAAPGFINFQGYALPTKYLVRTEDGWKCSERFISQFLSDVKVYTSLCKISVHACGGNGDCSGLTKEGV